MACPAVGAGARKRVAFTGEPPQDGLLRGHVGERRADRPRETMTTTCARRFAEPCATGTWRVPVGLPIIPNTNKKYARKGLATKGLRSQNASAAVTEHYLANNGYYLNENTQFSRPCAYGPPGAKRAATRSLIGDDQQYSALLALMLHQLGMVRPRRHGCLSEGAPRRPRSAPNSGYPCVELSRDSRVASGWPAPRATPPRAPGHPSLGACRARR